jgi:hypothetical protein
MDYEEALKEALAAVNSQRAQQGMAANIKAGNAAYGQLKEQAAASRSLEKQRLAKRMADMGIAAPQSLTVQNNSMMAGNRDIGDVSRQNQSYTGMQNAMIKQANADAATQAAGITAQMNAAEDAADLEEKMNEFDRYYRMYTAKKITASQFRKKTGMDVRGWGRPRPDKDPNSWFDLSNLADKQEADFLKTQIKNGNMTLQEALHTWNVYKKIGV